jgi:hypothetical protein
MILRRLTKHINEQNWFAVALDFGIVVIGVFMGIQVANWNDAQIKKGRETVYLQGVVEDIDNDVIEIEEIVLVTGSRMSALALLIESASDWRVPSEFFSSRGQILVEKTEEFDASSEFSVGLELFILSTLDGNRLAYETMINADGIGVIRNKTLVSNITL